MKLNLEKFLERLKELQGDGSVAALARRIGIRQNTFDLYIKGRRKPSVELVFSIIYNCGVSFEWLFGLSNERAPSEAVATAKSFQNSFRRPQSDLEKQIVELTNRVKALEDSQSRPTFACG